jgi:hypothetical protein
MRSEPVYPSLDVLRFSGDQGSHNGAIDQKLDAALASLYDELPCCQRVTPVLQTSDADL